MDLPANDDVEHDGEKDDGYGRGDGYQHNLTVLTGY